MTVRFSNALVAEAIQPFWAALQAGEFLTVLPWSRARTAIVAWRGCVRPVVCVRAAAVI